MKNRIGVMLVGALALGMVLVIFLVAPSAVAGLKEHDRLEQSAGAWSSFRFTIALFAGLIFVTTAVTTAVAVLFAHQHLRWQETQAEEALQRDRKERFDRRLLLLLAEYRYQVNSVNASIGTGPEFKVIKGDEALDWLVNDQRLKEPQTLAALSFAFQSISVYVGQHIDLTEDFHTLLLRNAITSKHLAALRELSRITRDSRLSDHVDTFQSKCDCTAILH